MAHRFGTIPTGNTTDRGYGYRHAQARRRYLAAHHEGDPCAICGGPMGPAGPDLHLDHCPHCDSQGCAGCNGDGYRGLTHGWCNRRDGARRGSARAHARRHATRLKW